MAYRSEIINWRGKAVVGPRNDSRSRSVARRMGSEVYLLVGEDREQAGRELVYVVRGIQSESASTITRRTTRKTSETGPSLSPVRTPISRRHT